MPQLKSIAKATLLPNTFNQNPQSFPLILNIYSATKHTRVHTVNTHTTVAGESLAFAFPAESKY